MQPDVFKSTEYETAALVNEVFELWFEQKIIREACKEKLGAKAVSELDVSSIDLNTDNQFLRMHQLLKTGVSVDIMGLDAFGGILNDKGEPVKHTGRIVDERKMILKHYIQMLIGVQEDPDLQIRKMARNLAILYKHGEVAPDEKEPRPIIIGVSGSK